MFARIPRKIPQKNTEELFEENPEVFLDEFPHAYLNDPERNIWKKNNNFGNN